MSEFKRQHPVAAVTRAIDLIRDNLITVIIILIFGAGGGGPSFLWMFAGLFVFLLIAGAAGWWRFVYRVEDGELQIRQGILVRKRFYMTRDRIQVIDVTSGIIQRIFGLVKVEIKTAGSTSREASLSAVSRAEADVLTDLLRKTPGSSRSPEKAASADDAEAARFTLPLKDLLIAASTSGSFGIALSIIATVFSQIEPLLDESEVYNWFLAVMPGETDTLFIVSVLLLFVVFAWLMSFFGTLFRFGDFNLTLHEDEIVIRRGIFEKKRITVPFNRIQAVRIVEGVLRQPFGYGTVYVESAGYGDQKGSGSVVLFPLIKQRELDAFLQRILPEYRCNLQAVKPPPRAVSRYIIRSAAVFALVLAGIHWLLGGGTFIWFLLIPGFFWGWLRFRDSAAGVDKERIVIRGRILARTTAVVRRNRAQDITGSSSWIQRIRGLANIDVSVASGDQGRKFQIRELDSRDAQMLLPWLEKDFRAGGGGERIPATDACLPGWGFSR
ncbi:MAG: PH domain-containing protein [Balneolaceae bacterium]